MDKTSTTAAPLPLEEGLFALPGETPSWIWAQTCATADCACRSAFIVATPLGRDVLLDRARLVQEAWYAGAEYADVAAELEGVEAFHIDIDSAEAFPPKSDTPLDLAADGQLRRRAGLLRICRFPVLANSVTSRSLFRTSASMLAHHETSERISHAVH